MRIFGRKISLFSSNSFSSADKSSCDCAEYKIEFETYKTILKSNLKVSLSVVEHWSSMKKLAFVANGLTKYG